MPDLKPNARTAAVPRPAAEAALADETGATLRRALWLDALDHCVEAAALYPCAAVGLDLVFERGYLRHHVLEVNAFGDFFPGLVDEAGVSVHRAEIEATAQLHWS